MKLMDKLSLTLFIVVEVLLAGEIGGEISVDPDEHVKLSEQNSSDVMIRVSSEKDKPLGDGSVIVNVYVNYARESGKKWFRESQENDQNSSRLIGNDCMTNFDCSVKKSWCKQTVCQCDDDHYASENRTECLLLTKDLHEPCLTNFVCRSSFSACISGKCKCQHNYLEHKKTCYGLPSAKCNRPTDCVSRDFSCVSGTCENATYYINGREFTSKPGFYSYWKPFKKGTQEFKDSIKIGRAPGGVNNYLVRDSPIPSSKELIKGPLEWRRSNYNLDRVIRDIKFNPMGVYCRVHSQGYVDVGRIEPHFSDKCKVIINGKELSFDKYDVLVEF